MKTQENRNSSIPFTKGYSEVNGLKMYYEIYGSGKPLVLIHGGGSTIQTTFGKVLGTFAENHKVIAVELQAHGHTADRDKPSSFEQDADDVAALLKNLNIAQADIFGFSNGGTTALQIAIRHPQLVDKLIVASAMFKKAGVPPSFWEFMKKATFNEMPREFKDAYLAINPNQEDLLSMFNRDRSRMLAFKDIPDSVIASIKARTLIVAGDKDVTTPEHAVEMSRLISNSSLMILPGGHGDYIGEITTLKHGNEPYRAAVLLIRQFLEEK
ncbi:alpha/beta fold hydrolase [Rubrolithibacter danxiaensis]|uniref:alpha/beta fold hydrolase n=1 Tax=Rubrolithibacter danxiaensis TaxID=3390805 RepID=UPI003BF7C9AB